MELFGIGPLELLFILIIALIVLGPKDMVKAGRTLGRFMRQVVTSDTWRTIQQASRELRQIPTRLIREAGIEDLKKQLPPTQSIGKELGLDKLADAVDQTRRDLSDWTTPAGSPGTSPDDSASNTIEPPILATPDKPLTGSGSETAPTDDEDHTGRDRPAAPDESQAGRPEAE
jgi:Sec-independent protein translocase protein TatA